MLRTIEIVNHLAFKHRTVGNIPPEGPMKVAAALLLWFLGFSFRI